MPHLSLNERDEDFIRDQIRSGHFADATEVVRAGLRLLKNSSEREDAWLRDEVAPRLQQLRDDPSLAIPADDVFARLEERHRKRVDGAS